MNRMFNKMATKINVKPENVMGNIRTEGKISFYTNYLNEENVEETVFYNPVQVFNRDISLLAINCFSEQQKEIRGEKFKGLHFLDALSASGLFNKTQSS